MRLRPDYAEAYNNRGAAYAGKGDRSRAMADFNEALRLRPDYAEAHANLGWDLAAKREDRTAACRALKKAWALRERLPDKGESVRKQLEGLKCDELGD
jgi:Flp pilus assembly protein TadD